MGRQQTDDASSIRDRIKGLVRVRAADLVPHPDNWREHPDGQRAALQGALAEIGWADAVLAREMEDGRLQIIDGHLRHEVAGNAEIPVLVLDVTEEEAITLLLTLDPLAGLAKTNAEMVYQLLDRVEIDNANLRALAESIAPPRVADGETDPDAVPDDPEEPVTQPGDLWVLGDHRLMCGDATNVDDVARLLGGHTPFIMVTDPPYGVEYDPAARSGKAYRTGTVANDDRHAWADAYALFPGAVAYIWHAGWFVSQVADDIDSAGFDRRAYILWKKPHFQMGRGHYHWQHEPCWYAARGSSKWCGDRKQSTVWDIAHVHRTQGTTDDGATTHGTQKPVECMRRPIANHGGKTDHVYDPFVGSGTTIIAAEQLGRRCFAMDVDPVYVDVAVRRWEEFTGRKAERE